MDLYIWFWVKLLDNSFIDIMCFIIPRKKNNTISFLFILIIPFHFHFF